MPGGENILFHKANVIHRLPSTSRNLLFMAYAENRCLCYFTFMEEKDLKKEKRGRDKDSKERKHRLRK